MCSGQALGTKEFKKEVLKSEGLLKDGDRQAVVLEGSEVCGLEDLDRLSFEALQLGLQSLDYDEVEYGRRPSGFLAYQSLRDQLK